MAKFYKIVTEEHQRLEKMTCALCDNETTCSFWPTPNNEFNDDEVTVEVKIRQGNSYPEGGWGTVIAVDICPDCFKNKLIPWLRSQGAKIEKIEYDW